MSNTILIADDDPVMIKLFEFNLGKAGYKTVACREGSSVLSSTLESHPDMVIFDLVLPGRSGLELIKDFRSHAKLAAMPIIVVTAQGRGSTKDALLAAGADCVFTKPFSPSLLLAKVEELLARQSREGGVL